MSSVPLRDELAGQLMNLAIVEWLCDDRDVSGSIDASQSVFSLIGPVPRADRHFDVGVNLPNLVNSLDSIPAGWHLHINENHCEGSAGSAALLHQLQCLDSLKRRVHLEGGYGRSQRCFLGSHSAGWCFQDAPEQPVHPIIIIHQQNSTVPAVRPAIHSSRPLAHTRRPLQQQPSPGPNAHLGDLQARPGTRGFGFSFRGHTSCMPPRFQADAWGPPPN